MKNDWMTFPWSSENPARYCQIQKSRFREEGNWWLVIARKV